MAKLETWTVPALRSEETRLKGLLKEGGLNAKAIKNVNGKLSEIRAALRANGQDVAEPASAPTPRMEAPKTDAPAPAPATRVETSREPVRTAVVEPPVVSTSEPRPAVETRAYVSPVVERTSRIITPPSAGPLVTASTLSTPHSSGRGAVGAVGVELEELLG